MAQNSVLNKRLSYDLQLITRGEAFQSDNDAISCYDRIVDDIAVLACMRMGLGKKAGADVELVEGGAGCRVRGKTLVFLPLPLFLFFFAALATDGIAQEVALSLGLLLFEVVALMKGPFFLKMACCPTLKADTNLP